MEDLKDGMCRCCASEGTFKDFTASYQWMGVEEIYSEMLRDCFDITLSTSLLNNGGICELCITQLRNAFNFKKQVQSTEEQFTKMQDRFLKGDIVKKELNQDPMENSDGGDNIDDDFSSPEYDVPIQSIKLEKIDTKTKKRPARATTSKAKKPKVEAGEPSGKRIPTDVVVKMERVESDTEQCDEEWQSTHVFTTEESEKISLNEEMNKHWVNIREILKWSNATPIRSYGGRGYLCCYCSKQFVDPRDLRAHTSQSHIGINDACFTKKAHLNGYCIKLDITDLFCNICGLSIDNVEELLEHLTNTHSIQIYTDIKNLIIPFKFHSEELQCCVCDEKFGAFKVLLAHMNDHIRNYVCEVCDSGFVNVKQLRGHSEIHKTGAHKCDQCGKVFSTIRSCTFHVNRVHRRTFVYKCGYCTQLFKESRQKQKHQLDVHGVGAVITCEHCERCFKSQTTYRIHVNRDHLKLRKFACTMCEMRFYKCSDLHDHMIRHTGERVYKCDVCLKAFARRKTLREHTRIHMDDKRFKCEHCDKGFVQKCNLRTHLLNKHKIIE